ncbi:MAG: glycosyltransferase family 4 protein [Verrucomicrobia bacterium]|nr:glycosyltransferase family 4 protein [Verrucomicrobiota bacterium]
MVVHIFADSIDERVGGLEKSVRRVAGYLARRVAEKVVIYSHKLGKAPCADGCECVDLGVARARLVSPLVVSGVGISRDERFRLDGLLLRSALERELARSHHQTHVVVSFFATTCGFVAQTVCCLLGLPHVCCVRGSDFSRGAKTPEGLYALEFSCRHARLVVTTSEEQRRFLQLAFAPSAPVRTIYNACSIPPDYPTWRPRHDHVLQLVTDTGYSFKKGTLLCIEAVEAVRKMGVLARLTVAGNVHPREAAFWTHKLQELESQPEFAYAGYLTAEDLCRLLLNSDLYVSGSLGEGCPNSVVTVLALGLPAVLPACGAIPELCVGMPQVWLFSPGDATGLQDRLTQACRHLSQRPQFADEQAVHGFRNRFTEQAEAEAWAAALRQAAGVRS